MPIEFVGDPDWEERVLGSTTPVLVQFVRGTCPICMAIEAEVDRLASELEGRMPVYRVDVEAEEDLVWAYEVMSTPTFIVFRDSEPVASVAGQVDALELWGLVEEGLAQAEGPR